MSNPLEPIIARHRLLKAAIAVTIRVTGPGANKTIVDRGCVAAGTLTATDLKDLAAWAVQPKHEPLYGLDGAAAAAELNSARDATERLAVLELAAVFERAPSRTGCAYWTMDRHRRRNRSSRVPPHGRARN